MLWTCVRLFTLYYYLFYFHRSVYGRTYKDLLLSFLWRRNILFFSSFFFLQFLTAFLHTYFISIHELSSRYFLYFFSFIKSVCIELKIDFMDYVIFLRNFFFFFFFHPQSLGFGYSITSIYAHILCFSIPFFLFLLIKSYSILCALWLENMYAHMLSHMIYVNWFCVSLLLLLSFVVAGS